MPTMSNLSSDSRDAYQKPTPTETQSELEPQEVMITFNDGARFQFRIEVPLNTDLAQWFSEQVFITAHEFSRNGHTPDLCVSPIATYINMANVSQIRELAQ